MKTSIYLLISLITISCKAQTIVDVSTFNNGLPSTGKYYKDMTGVYQNFLGTWEYINGNQTFRLTLFKTTKMPMDYPAKYYMDIISGSYKIIQNAGTINEVVLHDSVKYFPQSGETSTSIIYGRTANGIDMSGQMEDTCGNGGTQIVRGFIKMHIINPNATPKQANMTIEKGTNIAGQTFTIPTNVVLTKVN